MLQDYKDLLSVFHAHGVKYLIFGGYAVTSASVSEGRDHGSRAYGVICWFERRQPTVIARSEATRQSRGS